MARIISEIKNSIPFKRINISDFKNKESGSYYIHKTRDNDASPPKNYIHDINLPLTHSLNEKSFVEKFQMYNKMSFFEKLQFSLDKNKIFINSLKNTKEALDMLNKY